MDWKKTDSIEGDKVIAALSVAMNAEKGVDELFRRIVALELATAKNTAKAVKGKNDE